MSTEHTLLQQYLSEFASDSSEEEDGISYDCNSNELSYSDYDDDSHDSHQVEKSESKTSLLVNDRGNDEQVKTEASYLNDDEISEDDDVTGLSSRCNDDEVKTEASYLNDDEISEDDDVTGLSSRCNDDEVKTEASYLNDDEISEDDVTGLSSRGNNEEVKMEASYLNDEEINENDVTSLSSILHEKYMQEDTISQYSEEIRLEKTTMELQGIDQMIDSQLLDEDNSLLHEEKESFLTGRTSCDEEIVDRAQSSFIWNASIDHSQVLSLSHTTQSNSQNNSEDDKTLEEHSPINILTNLIPSNSSSSHSNSLALENVDPKRSLSQSPNKTVPSTRNGSPVSPIQSKPHPPDVIRLEKLSPFSPMARSLNKSPPIAPFSPFSSNTSLLSMTSCRKVSILLCIGPMDKNIDRACLYPHQPEIPSFSSPYPSPLQLNSNSSQLPPRSLGKASKGKEVILVNPTVFGKLVPTSVTVDSARLLSSISVNKKCEDWVRKFKFDEIFWNLKGSGSLDLRETLKYENGLNDGVVDDIAVAMISDALNGKNGVIFGHGVTNTIRLKSMFGESAISDNDNSDESYSNSDKVTESLGLLGTMVFILLHNQQEEKYKSKLHFTLSLVEVVGDDVLRDLLLPSSSVEDGKPLLNNNNKPLEGKTLRIRHPDSKGAVIENLEEITIESCSQLANVVKRAFQSPSLKTARQREGGRGHILATLKLCTSYTDDNDIGKSQNETLIQLVDLINVDSKNKDLLSTKVVGINQIEISKINERKTASVRKSYSGLRGILRGMILHEAQSIKTSVNRAPIIYRECTLTKLVQRALDNEKSRVVVLAAVCPKCESYAKTLYTLNYIHRLVVQPSQTAQSH